MIYPIDIITRDVRIVIDQNTTDKALILDGDEDTLTLNQIIRSRILPAVESVHKAAPFPLLESGHNFGADDDVYWEEQQCGWLLLPTDFMRFLSFKMSDWERAVSTAITIDNPLYALQRQRHKGLRGTAQRPVCAIVRRPEGLALEFYSCKSEDAFVERGLYLPHPTIDFNSGVDICEHCYDAVLYNIAALVLTTLGETNSATALSQIAQTMLQ